MTQLVSRSRSGPITTIIKVVIIFKISIKNRNTDAGLDPSPSAAKVMIIIMA